MLIASVTLYVIAIILWLIGAGIDSQGQREPVIGFLGGCAASLIFQVGAIVTGLVATGLLIAAGVQKL